jgi:hypothetical protein
LDEFDQKGGFGHGYWYKIVPNIPQKIVNLYEMSPESPAPNVHKNIANVLDVKEMHSQEEYFRLVGAPRSSDVMGWMEASELLLASLLAYGQEFLPDSMALRHFSLDLIVGKAQSPVVTLEVDRVSYSERHSVLEAYLYSDVGAMIAKASATWS